jgi:SAM-dependent methyltransferase
MPHFSYVEEDLQGFQTLKAIHAADNFNRWMYAEVEPYLKGEILEIGSGIGNVSEFFLKDGANITLSDVRPGYCEILKNRFKEYDCLKGVHLLDLVHPDFLKMHSGLLGRFDSVFAMNVVEHIEEDELALRNLHALLKPGGRIIILVPTGNWLYNGLDVSLKHFRRYAEKDMLRKLHSAGFSTERTWYFNALGILAWWFRGSLLRSKQIRYGEMDIYDKLVPVAKTLDKVFLKKLGLSVIIFGRKSE